MTVGSRRKEKEKEKGNEEEIEKVKNETPMSVFKIAVRRRCIRSQL
jgi:hypothetical protein